MSEGEGKTENLEAQGGQEPPPGTEVTDLLHELRNDIRAIADRVAFLEENAGEVNHNDNGAHRRHTPIPMSASPGAPNSPDFEFVDIGAEYASVRASVQAVRLPPNLTIPETTKQGVRKSDHQQVNLISRNARFCETALKVLAAKQEDKGKTFSDLFTVLVAQMKYLQDEQSALLVQSTFDPTVSRFFRSLQRSNSSFTPDALENLRAAATIASAYKPQRRGGSQDYSSRGRGRDLFHQQSSRGFPSTRGAHFRNDTFNRSSHNTDD
jgi:hypothetical protein